MQGRVKRFEIVLFPCLFNESNRGLRGRDVVANAWKQVSVCLPSIAKTLNVYKNFSILHLYIHSIYCLHIQNNLQNSVSRRKYAWE